MSGRPTGAWIGVGNGRKRHPVVHKYGRELLLCPVDGDWRRLEEAAGRLLIPRELEAA
jgi:hypothetical protein